MHKFLPVSRAGCLSAVALTALVAAPLSALAATHTAISAASHMQLKNSSGVVVCSGRDNLPTVTRPVATGCPTGNFNEQLFNANWGQIGSSRPVTVGATNPCAEATHTAVTAATFMQLKNSTGSVVCSGRNNLPTVTRPVATCPFGNYVEQLFDAGWGQIGVSRNVTVGNLSTCQPAGSGDLANVLNIQGQSLIAQGNWQQSNWLSIVGKPIVYTTNMQHLSMVSEGGKTKIRQRHLANSIGSDRVIAAFRLPNSNRIAIQQTIQTANNFSWGKTAYGGKLGFGTGGGANSSGGIHNPNGWTLRLSWDDGGELKAYSYAATRQSGNGNYGQEHATGWFITPGTPFIAEMEVQVNSSFGARDGWFKLWVDGELKLHETGIGWATGAYGSETRPIVDRLTWSEFHGGDKATFSPTSTTYNSVYDVSYEYQ